MLDVRRLEILAAAVREGSLAGAARVLDLTPSAVSQAVGALESAVRRPLLVRHGRGVRPTPAGERLALQAEAILADLATAEDEALGRQDAAVTLAAPPTVVAGLVPVVLGELSRGHPGLDVAVIETEGSRARSALLDGRVDVAVVDHHAHVDPDRDLPAVAVVLVDEPVLLWLPAGHALATGAHVALETLREASWVVSPPGSACADLLSRACAGAGFAPRVVATCAEYRSAASLVAAGLGVSIVPRLALGAGAGLAVAAVPTRVPITRRLSLLVRPGPRSTALRAVVATLQSVAARPGSADAGLTTPQ